MTVNHPGGIPTPSKSTSTWEICNQVLVWRVDALRHHLTLLVSRLSKVFYTISESPSILQRTSHLLCDRRIGILCSIALELPGEVPLFVQLQWAPPYTGFPRGTP